MDRRKFNKLAIFTPIALLLEKISPKKSYSKEYNPDLDINNMFKGDKNNSMILLSVFTDKYGKMVKFARWVKFEDNLSERELSKCIKYTSNAFKRGGEIKHYKEENFTYEGNIIQSIRENLDLLKKQN